MIEWRLVGPEGITFRAPSFACAAVVVLLVTHGKASAIRADGRAMVPAFPAGGDDQWLVDTFGKRWPSLLEANAAEVANALRSLVSTGEAGSEIVKLANAFAA